MAAELEAFLEAFPDRFICLPCLTAATSRPPRDVMAAVNRLLAAQGVEARAAQCLNCDGNRLVLRRC
jgi:hypothetical protein